MKLIYCADIRGEFARLYVLLKETIADMYIISGNLIDMPFYSDEKFSRYKDLQDSIKLSNSTIDKTTTCEDLAESVIADSGGKEHSNARELLELSEAAVQTMLKKYTRLEVILSTKPYIPVHVIPGCADLPLCDTALTGRQIDLTALTEADVTIAGIGGADVRIPGFPERNSRSHYPRHDFLISELLEKNSASVLAGAIPCAPRHEDNPPPFSLLSNFCVENSLPLLLCGKSDGFIAPWISGTTIHITAPSFSGFIGEHGDRREGGFFYEIILDGRIIQKIMLKKIVTDRIHDIAEFLPQGNGFTVSVIDNGRFEALKSGDSYEKNSVRTLQSPELKLFRDIRNFFKIHQTKETEHKVETLAKALDSLGDEYRDIALDLVGSTNIGIAQKGSDVDMVLYIRGGDMCLDDDEICSRFDEVELRIRDIVGDSCDFELIDRVNLDLVEESIRNRDCESPVLQRFVVYRGMCRPVNYRVIAPVEDMLNADEFLRSEAEKSMSEYLQVFGTTKDTNRSFDKYQTRLKSMGVEIPQVIADKIRMFLQK